MESGPADAVYARPAHPYTRALLEAAPVPDPQHQRARRLTRQKHAADVVGPVQRDSCHFAHRCPHAIALCRTERPALATTPDGTVVACHRWQEIGSYYAAGVARVEGYEFGRVLVDGEEHRRDVIVLPGRVVSDWRRRNGHELVIEDLAGVLDELPAKLVVGTGAYGRVRPDPDALAALRQRGVDVDVLPTGEAVRLFAELEPERTAAALHLTC
jgi:oligopeptide/dipeptide ABC transporter ATP-binding protein